MPPTVADRNTWYLTVPPRKPSSGAARHVRVRLARPAPLSRARRIVPAWGGVVSGPEFPSVQTWVPLTGPQFPATTLPRMYTGPQEGEIHPVSPPAMVWSAPVRDADSPVAAM